MLAWFGLSWLGWLVHIDKVEMPNCLAGRWRLGGRERLRGNGIAFIASETQEEITIVFMVIEDMDN